MSRVLADTSVWIDFFRETDAPASRELDRLLRSGLVCMHGLVRAEILSGTRSPAEYRGLRRTLDALPSVGDPPALWDIVARARWRLARNGFQASVADLVVAATASYHRKTLLTLDDGFTRIRQALPLKLYRIPVN